ncbi:uncharacterized protein SAPINGB_P003070 [Magnusiomyces paraingens]|uniref:Autophagy-related protein 29 n=1 Tax=Magnusiomyces paraingens TaxID=2606893 RepID=A0A5E8BII1_9ASCO|nr:uncharacterized protein SAPINGB_P003070 [Saprochaete ingens]VVT51360.1 unnamed protein product [Saprochaete ingens]
MNKSKNQTPKTLPKEEQELPKFVVYLRFPFSRNGFQDPGSNEWNEEKAHELREYLSTTTLKRGELDWSYLANRFQVSEPFILQQAIWLYERELEHVRDQMQRVNRHIFVNKSQEKFKTSFRSIFPLPKQGLSESWITPVDGKPFHQNTHKIPSNNEAQQRHFNENSTNPKIVKITLDSNQPHLKSDDYFFSLRKKLEKENPSNSNDKNEIFQGDENNVGKNEPYEQNLHDKNSLSMAMNKLTKHLPLNRDFKRPSIFESDTEDFGDEEFNEEKTNYDSKISDEFGEDDYDAFLT